MRRTNVNIQHQSEAPARDVVTPRWRFGLVLIALFCLAPVTAQDKVRFPNTAPPTFQVVHGVHKDVEAVILTRQDQQMQPIHEKAMQNRNGTPEEITFTRYIPVTTTMEVFVPLKSVAIYDGTGKRLTTEQALKSLKLGDVILESSDGLPVDPIYLRPVRPETIVLVTTRRHPRLGPIEVEPMLDFAPILEPLPKRLP